MSFATELEQILSQPTCIVGVGNPLRNDDAVGALIAERLENELPASFGHTVINAEDVIENHVFQIADSAVRNVLVIDAVQGTGGECGSLVLGKLAELEVGGGFSTHKLALSMATQLIEQQGKDVYLLGIAAENIDFGRSVSPEILNSAATVIELIVAQVARSH
ncbi:hydrogenase maturation protease [Chitinibacter bivalviorum]|uniref:Hydrogenase maturation protease n=1 Tax=Chitinibacter bivalviorum TaxID=2739434 RepID=A0A7H9BI73_9NEIS|nr:hydrogenase maturation protease [Chitinibacter bivalviorum]QLG88423.1 hydrogenase maturation protease [Chitinibacter bivalviorum]